MSTPRVIDVSHLPEYQLGGRALVWWGQVGMLVIEGTMFALAFATYFYLRTVVVHWPPPTVAPLDLTIPSIMLALLLVSCVPMYIADEAAKEEEYGRTVLWFCIAGVLCIAAVVLRWYEIAALDFKWYSHAYGSAVWVLLGLHTFHVVVSTGETIVVALIFLTRRRPEHKHYLVVRIDGLYWYWVVAWYILYYVIVAVVPHIG
jgi:heme/copper-type cytochrome/quinol oxidase subunit 3